MTDTIGPDARGALSLWAVSFSAVLAAHLVVLGAVLGQSSPATEGVPSKAVLIDLPAEPSTPSLDPEIPQGPPLDEPAVPGMESVAQPQPEAHSPEVPTETAEDELPEPQIELPPELPPVTETGLALPKKTEPPKQVQQAPPPQESLASAQAAAGGGRPSAAQVATWHNRLSLHLARKRRYPAEAQRKRQQGVVTVRFTLDQSGEVLSSAIAKSSGVPALDREGLAMVERAQPFPTPPLNMQAPIELVVPVQFSLR